MLYLIHRRQSWFYCGLNGHAPCQYETQLIYIYIYPDKLKNDLRSSLQVTVLGAPESVKENHFCVAKKPSLAKASKCQQKVAVKLSLVARAV